MARPKRFELLTPWFVAKYSIQLSYGRVKLLYLVTLAEREGFEPSITVLFRYAPLAGECLRPLGHLSKRPRRLPQSTPKVNFNSLFH